MFALFDRPKRPLRKACDRCSHPNLPGVNFCAQCGLMLVLHVEVRVWLREQKEMIALRESLPGSKAEFDELVRRRADEKLKSWLMAGGITRFDLEQLLRASPIPLRPERLDPP